MRTMNRHYIETYLQSLAGPTARLRRMQLLGETPVDREIKGYGYGSPVRLDFEVDGVARSAVLHTVSPGPFGHEHMADRAQILLWEHDAFNRLPRHVRSLDAGAFRRDGSAVSLGDVEEFFTLTEYAEGRGYYEDLMRLRADGNDGIPTELDLARADALCDYLAEIHAVQGSQPGLYVRRIRDLVGHAECIMGLIDSYPDGADSDPVIGRTRLQAIERQCVEWRWRLKDRVHRLRQVHGDFHPWNILFAEGVRFTVLDRSRGEWGEPADDVACLTMNYLFFSLQRCGRLQGGFEQLFRRFWDRYLEKSGDAEMLSVAAPFFAFRGLVMAHPLWYPGLDGQVRNRLLNFVQAVMRAPAFRPDEVNGYCGS